MLALTKRRYRFGCSTDPQIRIFRIVCAKVEENQIVVIIDDILAIAQTKTPLEVIPIAHVVTRISFDVNSAEVEWHQPDPKLIEKCSGDSRPIIAMVLQSDLPPFEKRRCFVRTRSCNKTQIVDSGPKHYFLVMDIHGSVVVGAAVWCNYDA